MVDRRCVRRAIRGEIGNTRSDRQEITVIVRHEGNTVQEKENHPGDQQQSDQETSVNIRFGLFQIIETRADHHQNGVDHRCYRTRFSNGQRGTQLRGQGSSVGTDETHRKNKSPDEQIDKGHS